MARQRRASGMCNRLHIRKMKGATSEAALALINCPHQDHLPVQAVAQRAGTKRSRQRLLAAHPRPSFEGTSGVSLQMAFENPLIRRSQHETRTQHLSYE
jgi:alpha/beta superfamily hydrolase